MESEQIKKRIQEALEAINPENSISTAEEKIKAWLFLKETLSLIYK